MAASRKKGKRLNVFLLLPVLSLVAISGCTFPGFPSAGGTGPGVTILAWEPELRDVFSDDNIDFLLKVQNQGESRARNVVAELTNIDPTEWGGFIQQQIQLGSLIPSDPVTQTPGETKTVQFQNLRAPLLSKGTNFVYEPTVRVSYDYTTIAQKPITIVDRTELVRIQQQGKTLPSSPTTQTAGPLSIQIIMGNFVKTSGQFGFAGQTFDIFPVQIVIVNTLWESGGSVTPKGFGGVGGFGGFGFGEADYPVMVKVIPPTGTSFVFSGGGGFQDCGQFQFTADLFKGKQSEITCELEVTNPPAFRSESLLQVELDYRFFVDGVTQINVHGTKEVGGFF